MNSQVSGPCLYTQYTYVKLIIDYFRLYNIVLSI